MNPQIRTLLEIQELDKEVLELNRQLGLYPQIWEDVKKKLTGRKEAAEAAEKALEKHHKERKRVEQKLRILADDHRKFETQQRAVKTNREYEAINKQIDGVRTRIAQLEEQGLALLSRDEEVEKAIGTTREEAKKYEQFALTEKDRIRVQFNEKKGRLKDVEEARKQVLGRVDADLLVVYERVSKRHPGSAVVPVLQKSCGGCHFAIPSDVLVKVHEQTTKAFCPNCSRILSEDEDRQLPDQAAG